jgi:hypothetical protein
VKVQACTSNKIKLEADEGNSSLRSSWREAGDTPAGEMAEEELSQGEAEQQFSDETAELNLQQSGKLRPQEMKKMTWEIMMIYPFAERNCSRGDCMNRASHCSSWTR